MNKTGCLAELELQGIGTFCPLKSYFTLAIIFDQDQWINEYWKKIKRIKILQSPLFRGGTYYCIDFTMKVAKN